MPQTSLHFEKTIKQTVACNYLLHLPRGCTQPTEKTQSGQSAQLWPLILFLHGAGERGDDLERVHAIGLARELDNRPDFPFIVVSPQCPENQWWSNDVLIALLDEIIFSYPVDPSRIYLTGLSMGGSGTWCLAAHYPNRFAAIAPVCGRAALHWIWTLGKLPIWVFHGAEDETVPIEESQRMVSALAVEGSSVKFTIYPNAGHDCWTMTYANDELYDWFLAHGTADPGC